MSFVQDVRGGLRLLQRTPAVSLAAVTMLGLGIGAATAIFGIVESVLLRPLPFPASARMVNITELDAAGGRVRASLANFRDWASGSRSFEALTASRGEATTVVSKGQSHRVYALRFHGDFMAVLGVRAGHGRLFTSEERRSGTPVAVVPQAFARKVWGDAARAVGENLQLGGVALTVVGVLEPQADERIDLLVPAAAFGPDASTRADRRWDVRGRLRADATLAAARRELQALAARIYAADSTASPSVMVASLLDDTVRGTRPALYALLAAGLLLILIACANVAHLLLARGFARRREMAVRQALGASRGRLIRQLIAESLPLAVLSGAAGITLAQWSFTGLVAMVPFSLPRRGEISMEPVTLALGLAGALAAGVIFALAPALKIPSSGLATRLTQSGRGTSGADGTVRGLLVAGQFALALAVLSCAGLLTKSFLLLTQVDAGVDYSNTLLAETRLPEATYATDGSLIDFWTKALAGVRALPTVEEAGVTDSAPLEGRLPNGTFEIVGAVSRQAHARYGVATSGFFRALGVPLLQGRLFDDGDVAGSPHVALVNRQAAEKLWPGESPIGRRIRWLGTATDPARSELLTIVGIVGDVRNQALSLGPVPEIYASFFQRPSSARDADLVVRTADPAALERAVRFELEALDKSLDVRADPLEASYQQSLAPPRFQATLIGFFAGCALLLSAVGLYSSTSYAVGRQTRDIGIRLALGGAPAVVRREVLASAMRMAAVGAVVGALLGGIGARLIATQLFGVTPTDPTVFAGAALVLATTAFFAAFVPARRAARTNPIEALRSE